MAADNRFALIIGNGDYQSPRLSKLEKPVNDAKLTESVFTGLGFQTATYQNASSKEMKKALSEFRDSIRPDSIVVFYFSGHGLQLEDDFASVKIDNFLLPIDIAAEEKYEVQHDAISVSKILDALEATQSSTRLYFLDCCRNTANFLSSGEKGFSKPSGKQEERRNSWVCYATAHGKPAYESVDDSPYSLYTRILAEELRKPGVALQAAYREVTRRVDSETGGKQTPAAYGTLFNEIYLSGEKPVSPQRPMTTVTDSNSDEQIRLLRMALEAMTKQAQSSGNDQVAALQKELEDLKRQMTEEKQRQAEKEVEALRAENERLKEALLAKAEKSVSSYTPSTRSTTSSSSSYTPPKPSRRSATTSYSIYVESKYKGRCTIHWKNIDGNDSISGTLAFSDGTRPSFSGSNPRSGYIEFRDSNGCSYQLSKSSGWSGRVYCRGSSNRITLR